MTIKDVCEKYDITADTLRYYEKTGVIPCVCRTCGGIRDYSEEDLRWVENAVCMRSAGLSVEAIAEYVRLYRMGDSTLRQRRDLLAAQRQELLKQKECLDDALRRLENKIARYDEALMTGRLVWRKEDCSCPKE